MSITIVHADDWVGVYKDGKLLGQGHSFQEEELLRMIGIEVESYWVAADPVVSSFPQNEDEMSEWGWNRE